MKCLVVFCHPVPESFGAALKEATVETLSARGWDLRLIDLYAEKFDPVLSTDERRHYNDRAPTDPALKPHTDALAWAEAVVFVYPTWWYGLPAMLKGWFDRVWATDVAFRLPPDGGRIVSLVAHIRKVGIVTTCGAPWWLSVLVGQPGRKTILRGIRAICAPRASTMYLAHYNMDSSTPASRAAYIAKVKARLARW